MAQAGSLKCENSNENSNVNATVQNVGNMLGELNPAANIKCEICMYKNKGIYENFQTVAEIEKCKWKYDDNYLKGDFYSGVCHPFAPNSWSLPIMKLSNSGMKPWMFWCHFQTKHSGFSVILLKFSRTSTQ